jgi:hypothetical protein
LFVFFYEETTFTFKAIVGSTSAPAQAPSGSITPKQKGEGKNKVQLTRQDSVVEPSFTGINHSIPLKSYREGMAFVTETKGPFKKFFCHTY